MGDSEGRSDRAPVQCFDCDYAGNTDQVLEHYMDRHVAPSTIPFVCTMKGCQFKGFTRMKAWTHCQNEHGADRNNGAVEDYCSGTYKSMPTSQLTKRRRVDRRDCKKISWEDPRGYKNDRTRYGKSYVPDRWVPRYKLHQKNFTSYTQRQRRYFDEEGRKEDQRRVSRFESLVEKHNIQNNQGQNEPTGASSFEVSQRGHPEGDHSWETSREAKSKRPSKGQPQKESHKGVESQKQEGDSKKIRSKDVPGEKQTGEASKRVESEDKSEEELHKRCTEKAESRELAGKKQPKYDHTETKSRTSNGRIQQEEGLKRTRSTVLDGEKQLTECLKRVKSNRKSEGDQPEEKSGQVVHEITTQEEQLSSIDQGLGQG